MVSRKFYFVFTYLFKTVAEKKKIRKGSSIGDSLLRLLLIARAGLKPGTWNFISVSCEWQGQHTWAMICYIPRHIGRELDLEPEQLGCLGHMADQFSVVQGLSILTSMVVLDYIHTNRGLGYLSPHSELAVVC